jgi:hypothetical protein
MSVISRRLDCQQLKVRRFIRPEELIRWMGCIQAQDFAGARWGVGCRLGHAAEGVGTTGIWTDAAIQREFDEGRFLRLHILRPTWHFVLAEDVRWMLELTASRIKAGAAGYRRQLELDPAVFRRSHGVLVKALEGGQMKTRGELMAELNKAKILTNETRLGHLLMEAELDKLLCSGPLRGKQFTYMLLEERAPAGKSLMREEAVGELVFRYFSSRGPATLQDFAWWSGLTVADGRLGVEVNGRRLVKEELDGQVYYSTGGEGGKGDEKGVWVLPPFDEYSVAYTDRGLILPRGYRPEDSMGALKPLLIRDGKVVGSWQRSFRKKEVEVEVELVRSMGDRALKNAFKKYGLFLEKELTFKKR